MTMVAPAHVRPPAWRVHLALGRVSNLPTVWSDVAAGMVLGGGPLRAAPFLLAGAAVSAFYLGGMYLNDAFDRRFDAGERPERPIPAGFIEARVVFATGLSLMVAGLAALGAAVALGVAPMPALGAAGALVAAIVLYDARHKQNPV